MESIKRLFCFLLLLCTLACCGCAVVNTAISAAVAYGLYKATK